MKKVYGYSIDLTNESDGSEVTQITVKKDVPYIVGFTFTKYDYERNQEQITGYFYKKYTIYQILIYRDGIVRIKLNLFHFYRTVKYHVIHHDVLNYVVKITIVMLISIHMSI